MNFQKLFFFKNGKYLTIRLWSLILIDQLNEKLFKKLTWAIKKNTLYKNMDRIFSNRSPGGGFYFWLPFVWPGG